jgi:hypothetical protein
MITEIITFAGRGSGLITGRSAPAWRANPDLIRKNYLFDAQTRRAGGVYLRRKGRRTSNSEPVVQYFETPLVADDSLGQTIIDGETAEV